MAGVVRSFDDAMGNALKTRVVPIVGKPPATKGSADDPNEIGINHRHAGSSHPDAERSVDVLTDAGMMQIDRKTGVLRSADRQPMKRLGAPPLQAKGAKFGLQLSSICLTESCPVGKADEESLNEGRDNLGSRALKKHLGHREPIGVAPAPPHEGTPMPLVPSGKSGSNASGANEVGSRRTAGSSHRKGHRWPTLGLRNHSSRSVFTIGVGRKAGRLTAIDLFAGAGGLSLGLHAAGFEMLLAVESSPDAAETYFRNFRDASADRWIGHRRESLLDQISAGLAVAPTSDVLQRIDAVRALLGGKELDLLAGGPPCQGFSLAGARDPADPRNALAHEFLSFVKELQPRAVLIENVEGIGYRFGGSNDHSVLAGVVHALQAVSPGYRVQVLELNARAYGIAQHRPRVLVVGVRQDVELSGIESGDFVPVDSDAQELSVYAALGDLSREGYLWNAAAEYPADLALARRLRFDSDLRPPAAPDSEAAHPANHEQRSHSAVVQKRFHLLLAMAAHRVHHSIVSLPRRIEGTELEAEIARRLAAAEPAITFPLAIRGTTIARSLQDLVNVLREVATLKHSQRALVATRPAPTMLSLPDDHVHYLEPRTLTVREVARIQSFPDSFVFCGKATTGGLARRVEVPQYTQVANAVPPVLAKAIGGRLRELLEVKVTADEAHQIAEPASAYLSTPAVAI